MNKFHTKFYQKSLVPKQQENIRSMNLDSKLYETTVFHQLVIKSNQIKFSQYLLI